MKTGRLPVPLFVTGYDATRPVPMWDADGRRLDYVAPVATVAVRDVCEFCLQSFEHRARWLMTRRRRTCSPVCAALLRKRIKSARGNAKFQAARAARWLSYPKEVVADGE